MSSRPRSCEMRCASRCPICRLRDSSRGEPLGCCDQHNLARARRQGMSTHTRAELDALSCYGWAPRLRAVPWLPLRAR
jgi:hypothetical protein